MRNQTQLSRADLLICLAAHGETHLDALAAALGYDRRPEPKEAAKPPPQRPLVPTGVPPPEVPPPIVSPVASKARYYRVVAQRTLEPTEVTPDEQVWFRVAKPYQDEQDLRAPAGAKPPPSPELMRWSQLWPFLKLALGAHWEAQALDLPRIVERLGKGQMLRRLPRQQRQGWAGRGQLIVDYAEPLLPFWHDFNELRRRLPDLRGQQGLNLIAFPDGDPGGRCWSYSGGDWREIDGYEVPSPGTPVLVLSDLGCIDTNEVRRRQWRRLGSRLQRAGCRPIALLPCPPRWWDRELSRLFYPVCWDRAVRPPRYLGTPGVWPTEREEQDAGAERLLALLSPAIRIEPALLRAVRYLLPAQECDVGSEAAAWNHALVHATPLAFYYDGKALSAYREKFRQQDSALRHRIAGLIEKHHAHLSPVISYEERWLAADLGKLEKQAPIPAEVRRFLERIVKTLYTENVFTAATRAWFLRVSPRQHEDVWQNALLAAAWMAAHLPQLRAGKPLLFPAAVDLAQVSWLFGQGRTPRRYTLRQRGQALYLEEPSQTTSAVGFDAPGSPLADVQVQAPCVQYHWIEGDSLSSAGQLQSLEQPIFLSGNGQLRLRTDRQELTIDSIERPKWAEAIGRDEYGLYTDCCIQGIVQHLRWIAPGEFMMGSPANEAERWDDETQHRVILTEGFWLADTACTQALWQVVMGDNPSRFKGENRPVETVSWDDVQRFIERLNALAPDGGFRLPTEAEWEYACRAGTTTPFWFGDQISPEQANYHGGYPYAGGPKGQYREQMVDVKALPCNSWGLYQMHGNVWEWCQDWDGAYPSATAVDPVGPAEGAGRVRRGGGWFDGGGSVRSARRRASDPAVRYDDIGFRLARGQVVWSASLSPISFS